MSRVESSDVMTVSAPRLVDKYCRAFLAIALANGLDLNTIFKDKPFLAEMTSTDNGLLGPVELSEITRRIKRVMDDEFYGFSGRRSCVGTLALGLELALPSRNLRDALDKIFKFYHKVNVEKNLVFKPGMTSSRVCVQFNGEGKTEKECLTEWFLVYWRFLAGWLIGQTIPATVTRFQHSKNGPIDEYKKVFGGHCLFGETENSFSINNRFLDFPIVATLDDLRLLYAINRVDLVSNFGIEDTLTQKLRAHIRASLLDSDRICSIEDAARKYHMSVASLRRKLTEEGTSYRALKENVRQDVAIDWLRTRSMPISEVAIRCGFAEMSSFCRAMKNWTGRTPSEYREAFISQDK